MRCPRCGGTNIVIEGCEIYCLSDFESSMRKKCLYHFTAGESRRFRRWAIEKYASENNLSYSRARYAHREIVYSLYAPKNMQLEESDQQMARVEIKRMTYRADPETKSKANAEYYSEHREERKRYAKDYYRKHRGAISKQKKEKRSK